MAIRRFDVGPAKSLVRARADDVANIVAIAGPNGAGKSTVIEQLRARRGEFLEPGSELLFVGAHRTWRSGAVSEVSVLGFGFEYEEVLKQDSIPGFSYLPPGGLHWLAGLARQASSADDAQALVKTALVKIRNKQRDLVARVFADQGGQVEPGTVPDLFGPFAELINTLLPHLRWAGVDVSNANDIKCYFASAANASPTFDIDDLSSGEKAAVALFLPFIEREVKRLTGETPEPDSGLVPLTVLIDEPELHLHPLLQLNVLDYMRRLAAQGRAQFIFSTHSTTLLDALTEAELYLLSPAELAPDNQLSRLTHSHERLELARSITGSTHLLTRAKPIVLIEGQPDEGPTTSDERLLRLLVPEVTHWAVVPMAGKSQVIKSAVAMRGADLQLPGIPVFGLIDADTSTAPADRPDFVIEWPVSMVENLLLDVDAIARVLGPYAAVTGVADAPTIASDFRRLADERRDREIGLRVRALMPKEMLAVDTLDLTDLEGRIIDTARTFLARAREADLPAVGQRATDVVDNILATGRYLELFHGKELLRAFYQQRRVADTGLSWNAFLTELGRTAGQLNRAQALTTDAIRRIKFYVPRDLPALIRAEAPSDPVAADLASRVEEERRAWEAGHARGQDRERLRHDVFALAGRVAAERGPEAAHRLFRDAAAIGTD